MNYGSCGACACIAVTVVLLMVILIPLSFSYVEYHEYALQQRKSTGSVDTSSVYSRGRYAIGPDAKFIKYKADAHLVELKELDVFSAGASDESIGTSFKLNIFFTYLLKQDEIGSLHQESGSSYREIIESRAKEAIKNEAIFITFREYFEDRLAVEKRLRDAVELRWESGSLHCYLDQFLLGKISIPNVVAEKQLESKIQNERNDREKFLQEAVVERDLTGVEVNSILLERNKVLRTANAQASLTKSKATSLSQKIVQDAQNNGAMALFEAAGISTQEHKISFGYIRTLLEKGDGLDLDISYLNGENVLKTKAV